ncbi:ankyrin repeat-containing domain protein [Dactylonectria estremocensis]|uniref:Ankyrin repeat-containing domain protein n=1 Tax=Dactylonectria estremocensis TaxID=1079267 RepID=A0A9P9DJH2_9HYPO|nr:ankyrin repeat-containing domain protein [Dactylonectria estremocensis]
MALPTYTYKPIDLATDAIRLVRLSKGYIGDSICCEIFETFLHQVEGVPYEALSYAWGGTLRAAEIILNGCIAKVTSNLYAALRQLRLEHRDRVQWIDAICIDQQNKKEQGHQVGQMKEIYTNSEHVMIWLGPSNNQTDFLMDAIDQVHSNARSAPKNWRHSAQRWQVAWPLIQHQLGGTHHTELGGKMGEALREILQRPWFQGVWVIQEVASARAASVMCGSKAVSTQTFTQIPSLLGITPDEHTQAVLDVMPGYLRRSTWWSESQDLATLLGKFRHSKANNPRDKIFALLGISSDACDKDVFRPNYEQMEFQVIQGAVSFLLFGSQTKFGGDELPLWKLSDFLEKLDALPLTIARWAVENNGKEAVSALLVSNKIDVNAVIPAQYSRLDPSNKYQRPLTGTFARQNYNDGTDSTTFLAIAAEMGHDAVVAALLAREGIQVNFDFPLAKAAKARRPDIVKLLLAHKDIDVNHGAPLVEAVKANTYLNIQVPEQEQTDAHGDGSLASSVQKSHGLHAIPELENKYFNIDARRRKAAMTSKSHIYLLLLNHGADLEVRDILGRTSLSWAVAGFDIQLVKTLLGLGADVDAADCAGRTPLSWAAQGGIAGSLLDAGANIESRDKNGRTPLSWAAENRYASVAKSLLDAGADAKSRDEHGRTPLSRAAGYGTIEIVELLLKHGAEADCVDVDGRTPQDWAGLRNHFHLMELFTPIPLKSVDV